MGPLRACALMRRRWALGSILLLHLAMPPGEAPHAVASSPATLTILSASYRDLDGDRDAFPDTGETGRLGVSVRYEGPPLAEAVLALTSADPDVACIVEDEIPVGSVAQGQTLILGSPEGVTQAFVFRASDDLQTVLASDPARIDLCLVVVAGELPGPTEPACFSLPADLDFAPTGPVEHTPGPDGVPGTADDGTMLEDFDVDRDGNGQIDLSDGRDGMPNDTLGYTVGTASGALEQLRGIACGGFKVPPQDPNCRIDPDNDMDWHVHCPPGECPPPHVVGSTTAFSRTPIGGALSRSGRNSLHWGAHVDPASRVGDTTTFRQLAAFTTRPIDLTPEPRAGDLVASFYQIADLMDHNDPRLDLPFPMAVDYGDVQVRIDANPDPEVDAWGAWDKLVPFENAYDHVPYVWSYWGAAITYCNLTPADTGTGPPAPRGVHETMCRPSGVWSHCGNAYGVDHTYQCPGPGVPGSLAPSGGALWVQTRFSLAAYAGARIQIRWIAQGWEFDPFGASQNYRLYGYGWENSLHDDGWWIDDIQVTGTVRPRSAPVPDDGPSPGGTCPPPDCDDLDRDGYGAPGHPGCLAGGATDCDDTRREVFPGADELCDGLDNDCDGAADEGSGGVDADGDGVTGACDNCPTVPNADQDPSACDQRVVDVVLDLGNPVGRGAAIMLWRTTAEVDVRGFDILRLTSRGERIVLNDALIPCADCTGGAGVSYAFVVPRHKSAHDLFVALVRRNGETELYGPASPR